MTDTGAGESIACSFDNGCTFAMFAGNPVIALLACAPYAMRKLPQKISAVVCTFCEGPEQFASFAEFLNGKLKLSGRCPVKL